MLKSFTTPAAIILAGLLTPILFGYSLRADELASAVAKPDARPFAEVVKSAVALNPEKTLHLDRKQKCLFVDAQVVLTAGLLEMLCCPAQTKEHESILSTGCQPRAVHAGLLALGAEPGQPAQFGEEYQPPKGETLAITLMWHDEAGKLQNQDSRQWIRTATRRYFVTPMPALPEGLKLPEDSDLKYDSRQKELIHYGVISDKMVTDYMKFSDDAGFQKAVKILQADSQPSALPADWVFVGSQFREDPETGQKLYLADAGDFICVANFPAAMIDVAIKSSAADSNRGYEANSDIVPPIGTPVLIKIQRTADIKMPKSHTPSQ